jgi:hypothetical protein
VVSCIQIPEKFAGDWANKKEEKRSKERTNKDPNIKFALKRGNPFLFIVLSFSYHENLSIRRSKNIRPLLAINLNIKIPKSCSGSFNFNVFVVKIIYYYSCIHGHLETL